MISEIKSIIRILRGHNIWKKYFILLTQAGGQNIFCTHFWNKPTIKLILLLFRFYFWKLLKKLETWWRARFFEFCVPKLPLYDTTFKVEKNIREKHCFLLKQNDLTAAKIISSLWYNFYFYKNIWFFFLLK